MEPDHRMSESPELAPSTAELDPEDAKLVVLARAAKSRTGADEGAAVRDSDGRTYAAATVALPSLALSALQAAVAAAVSSGVSTLAAAAVVSTDREIDPRGVRAVRDVTESAVLFLADPNGQLRSVDRHRESDHLAGTVVGTSASKQS